MAQTYTSTRTYTRILFLKKQVIEVLQSTTQISDSMLEKLLQAIEKQYIHQIDVYAFDYNNLCRARLNMSIDWDEYQRQMAIGKITISIDTRWKNDLLPQTYGAIYAFNDYVNEYGLRTEWRVVYSNWVHKNPNKLSEVRNFLGTSPSAPMKWAGKTIDDYVKNRDFPEFGIGLHFVE